MDVKCSVYVATSVDGFIAGPDGDLEWLHRPEYASSGQIGSSYETFISSVDALIVGRKTFEQVLSFASRPYEGMGMPVIVLSSQEGIVPERLQAKVSRDAGNPEAIVARRAAEGHRHLYVDGGITVQRFLQAGFINEITITRIPIVLGGGIPLFGSVGVEVPLRLLETTEFDNGLVQDRYEVVSLA